MSMSLNSIAGTDRTPSRIHALSAALITGIPNGFKNEDKQTWD